MSAFNRLTDRCGVRDCGAQAFVRTELEGSGGLEWCGHHYMVNSVALLKQGFVVTDDEREFINKNPSISANAV